MDRAHILRFHCRQGGAKMDANGDKAQYQETKAAMKAIGFGEDVEKTLQSVVATVLHLGQIEFQAKGDACDVANKNVADNIADLLGTHREIS